MNERRTLTASGQDLRPENEAAISVRWGEGVVEKAALKQEADEVSGKGKDKAKVRPPFPGVWVVAAFIVALLGLGIYRWIDHHRAWVTTDNAYVVSHVHQIGSRVAGTVEEVLFEDNERVKDGEVIARLDKRDFEVKVQQAKAQLGLAKAQQEESKAQVEQAQAQVKREEAHAVKATSDLARAEVLAAGDKGAISKQEFDAAQAAADGAKAALESARSTLKAAEAAVVAAEAQVDAASAALAEHELQLKYTEITAPVCGVIGKKNIEVGNRVQPGQTLVGLVQPDSWVVANLKETQLAKVHIGQKALIYVDAFPGAVLEGRVESLSPASGAQFALLPPDNATGNFTKIVQRIPVKIELTPESLQAHQVRLAAGMSTVVKIKVGNEHKWW